MEQARKAEVQPGKSISELTFTGKLRGAARSAVRFIRIEVAVLTSLASSSIVTIQVALGEIVRT
jgi:hypothetical protein